MAESLTSPHLIDLIVLFALLEGAFLIRWLRGQMPARAVIATILPGLCLMLALRAALAGVAWPWVPAALAVALIAHLWDIKMRWRR